MNKIITLISLSFICYCVNNVTSEDILTGKWKIFNSKKYIITKCNSSVDTTFASLQVIAKLQYLHFGRNREFVLWSYSGIDSCYSKVKYQYELNNESDFILTNAPLCPTGNIIKNYHIKIINDSLVFIDRQLVRQSNDTTITSEKIILYLKYDGNLPPSIYPQSICNY